HIGLDDEREAHLVECLEDLLAVIHDEGAGIAHPQLLEKTELERLRLLESVRGNGIDHRNAERLYVSEESVGVEEHSRMLARVGRGAGAVHDHRVSGPPGPGIEGMTRVINLLPGQPPPGQFRDEPSGPVRVLVEYANRSRKRWIHVYSFQYYYLSE